MFENEEKFREYLYTLSGDVFRQAMEVRHAFRLRLSVEDLERDFDSKSMVLEFDPDYELGEVYLEEFIQLLFERHGLFGSSEVLPFEEIQSPEYRLWLKQKLSGGRSKSQCSDSGQSPLVQIDYSGYRMWRYNPVVFFKEGKKARHRLLLLDDDETLTFLENRKFAIMSPVTYVGRTNSYKNARYLYAFAIDLDGIDSGDLGDLLAGMRKGGYPAANIIVNSGHGVHVYFLLESPLAMFETNIPLLNKLKAGLTKIVWLVSRLDTPQIQSVVQGFRLPGTLTKFGKPIRAFYNSQTPLHTIDELNGWLSKDYKLTDSEISQLKDPYPHNPAKVTRDEAKKRWPEWYASRVIGRNRVGKKWNVNRGLYDWWLNKMRDGSEVTVHHRYWCILTLVVYAVKCNVPREKVLADALALVPSFDFKTQTVDNPFTEDDVYDAMRAYDEEYNKWPVRIIESTTGIRIQRCRRNGRQQNVHLSRIRMLQDADYPNGSWREGNGRKSDESKVQEWRQQHPDCKNKSQCARDTGLSRPTVHRWWNDTLYKKSDELTTNT